MNPVIGYIAAAVTTIIWGLIVVVVKRARTPAQVGLFISMLAGCLGLAVASLFMPARFPTLRELWSSTGILVALTGIFLFPLATIAYYEGIQRYEISLIAPLTRLKVIFIAFIVVLFGLETVSWKLALSCLLAVIGAVLLIYRRPLVSRQSNNRHYLGVMMALLASLFWAIGDVLSKEVLRRIPPLPTTLLALAAGMLVYFIFLTANGQLRQVWSMPLRDMFYFSVHGLFSSALGYVAFFISIEHLGVTRASVITASWPLISFLAGLVFYKEALSPAKLLGMLIIMASVFLAVLK